MRLNWEPPRQGLARGFSHAGHQLAQIAHVYSSSGDDLGWMVWLVHQQGEHWDHYDSPDAAKAAAEAALNTPPAQR